MARHTKFVLQNIPIQHKNQSLRMKKPYTTQDFTKHTVLTDDVYTYVSFFFDVHKKAMKFNDQQNKEKYGDPNQYKYNFYWKQSEIFYKSAKAIDVEASPVAAYYCMLNAAKAYISYTSESADDFVKDFGGHGILEDKDDAGNDLSTISIKHKDWGVFPLFASKLDEDFYNVWPNRNISYSLKTLLYNMAFIHRAYMMTYAEKSRTIDELFIPLERGTTPTFYKANDGKAYLVSKIDKRYFSPSATKIPSDYIRSFGETNYNVYSNNQFWLISSNNAKYNSGSVSSEIKELNAQYRKNYTYIKGNNRMWYLKRTQIQNDDVVNLSNMTLIMAAMHRISEIARYKPEQLRQ